MIPPPARAGTLGSFLRIVIAAALVALLLWQANPSAVAAAFAIARWPPLLLVAGLVLVDRGLMAYRWFALLRTLGRARPSLGVLTRVFFVSSFVGTFLPGSVGGDAARAYALARHQVPLADAAASVFVDRMLGVLSLLLMALAGLALAADLAADAGVIAGLAMAAGACAVAAALVFSPGLDRAAERIVARVPSERWQRAPLQVLNALRRYGGHRRVMVGVLGASLAVQVLRVLQAYLLGVALGLTAPMAAYFAFVPPIMLVMLLPITVNGIGTSQAAFMWFFAKVGMPGADAFALSVLFVGLQVIGNLPGALLFAGAGLGAAAPERGPQTS